jgi:hypothetical protein
VNFGRDRLVLAVQSSWSNVIKKDQICISKRRLLIVHAFRPPFSAAEPSRAPTTTDSKMSNSPRADQVIEIAFSHCPRTPEQIRLDARLRCNSTTRRTIPDVEAAAKRAQTILAQRKLDLQTRAEQKRMAVPPGPGPVCH